MIHKVNDFSCSHAYLSGRVGWAIDTLVEKKHLDIIYHLGRWLGGEVALPTYGCCKIDSKSLHPSHTAMYQSDQWQYTKTQNVCKSLLWLCCVILTTLPYSQGRKVEFHRLHLHLSIGGHYCCCVPYMPLTSIYPWYTSTQSPWHMLEDILSKHCNINGFM